MKKLILTDVCDTLIDLNSTYDYIKFLCKHNYWNKFLWKLLNNRYFWLFSYITFRLTWLDPQRKLTFYFFKNMKIDDLKKINQSFRKFYISKKTKILDKIIEHKNKWDKVVLVSASVNPPIDMLWSYLWVDYFSSELEEKDWIYTWKVKEDYLWNKESLFVSKKLDNSKYDNVSFYTDNLSDIWFITFIQKLSKNSNFYLIIKSERIKNKRLKLLHSNNIKNYEFIS
jgi:phosphoserine phosphatase